MTNLTTANIVFGRKKVEANKPTLLLGNGFVRLPPYQLIQAEPLPPTQREETHGKSKMEVVVLTVLAGARVVSYRNEDDLYLFSSARMTTNQQYVHSANR